MAVLHDTEQDARLAVHDALDDVAGDRWMVAVWNVRDGKIGLSSFHTWQFPRGDYAAAVKHLREALDRDLLQAEAQLEPLPRADIFRVPGEGDGEC